MDAKPEAIPSGVRQAELVTALSVATDLGMGQPLEFAMQSCQAAMRLADKLNLTAQDRRVVYFQSLLRYIGCNIETHLLAAVFGDELTLRTDLIHADNNSLDFLRQAVQAIRSANPSNPPVQMLQAITQGMMEADQFSKEFYAGHCEVAERLAERLGFDKPVVAAIKQVYARWDGKGIPALKGEAIAPGMLVVSLAQDAVYMLHLGGVEMAVNLVQQRKGTLYAPQHVDLFCLHAREILAGTEMRWKDILALEPEPQKTLTEDELERACQAMADFVDMKSPYLLGHSPGVARIAEGAAQQYNSLPPR